MNLQLVCEMIIHSKPYPVNGFLQESPTFTWYHQLLPLPFPPAGGALCRPLFTFALRASARKSFPCQILHPVPAPDFGGGDFGFPWPHSLHPGKGKPSRQKVLPYTLPLNQGDFFTRSPALLAVPPRLRRCPHTGLGTIDGSFCVQTALRLQPASGLRRPKQGAALLQ